MVGDADLNQRSSSPLKRRASSMDPEQDTEMKGAVDGGSPTEPRENNDAEGASSKVSYPRAMSVDLPNDDAARNGEAGVGDKTTEPPPLQEQIKTIQTLLQAFIDQIPKAGEKGYAVSRSWVTKALALGGDPKFVKAESSPDESLGPVDNSDIIQDTMELDDGTKFVRLKPGVGMEDLEFFPEDAWNMVMDWYGLHDGQLPIERQVINTATDPSDQANLVFELNPPVFTVHRLWSSASDIALDPELKDAPAAVVVTSSATPYNQAFKDFKDKAGIPLERKMRLHSILPQPQLSVAAEMETQSALTPPDSPERDQDVSSPELWSKLLVDVGSFYKVDSSRRSKLDVADQTGNPNYNGKSPLSYYGLAQSQTLILDEEVAKNDYVSTYFGKRGSDKVLASRGAAQSKGIGSGRNSPAPSVRSGPTTRGRAQQKKKKGRGLGAVGLGNLGNTCYMNSALQCVRSVEELTKYFLTDEYKPEINTDNVLGYHGQVAVTYGSLLKELYSDPGRSVSPRDFKNTIGRCRPTFSGFGQQDSQEFLGFLLDGLQEDLSRIRKKPYIEKPDSTDEMIGDDAAIRKMADQVWDITRKRDDSVIADLFTGMYKSTLKCPVCEKISITFDPFNNLTLPLPVEDMWSRKVNFYPLNDVPVQFQVDLPKHSAMEMVKQFLSKRTGVPCERLIGAEDWKQRLFKIYSDNDDINDTVTTNDQAVFYELESAPTNWPKRSSPYRPMLDVDNEEPFVDPRTERMVVPVVHRKRMDSPRYARDESGPPSHFIVLNREEAHSEDAIRRKILEKAATLSTWTDFADNEDSTDPETLATIQSDADSSGDSKVAAHSVEGEDDLVEVSMKDAGGPQANQPAPSGILKQFNKKRPSWVDPKVHLPPQLQNLFDMSYFSEKDEDVVPTGWHSVDKREFPRLSTRAPPDSSSEQDANSPGAWTNGGESDAESNSDRQSQASNSAQTRMNDESSDEEPVRPPKVRRLRLLTSPHARTSIKMRDRPKDSDAPLPPSLLRPSAGYATRQPLGLTQKQPKTRAQRAPIPMRSGPKGKKKLNHRQMYGKKGAAKRRNKERRHSKEQQMLDIAPQPAPQPLPQDDTPGALVRIGEGIVVDWDEAAWDVVFGGDSDNQGSPTWGTLEHVADAAQDQKREGRRLRRRQGVTLDECLDEFERAEILSEQDTWYCPRCKEHRRASKKFDLWKSPDILVVHLKRFSSSGYRREKVDVMVQYPIEGLDLTQRVLNKESGKEEIYDLIGVDEHAGGLGGGHYTATAKNFVDGKWYHYNDSIVSTCEAGAAVTKMAYLLFYRRRASGPLGGPRFKEIFETFDADNTSDDDNEQDGTDSGEGRRLGGGSSPIGSSRLGNGAGATHPHGPRGLANNTMFTRSGDDDDVGLYDGSSSTNVGSDVVERSVEEDEGIGMSDMPGFQAEQPWNFTSLDMNMNSQSTSLGLDEYASDDAQASDAPEPGSPFEMGQQFDSNTLEHAAPPPPNFDAQIDLSDINNADWDRKMNGQQQVIAVPPGGDDNDAASTEAAEIHLDDEDDQRPSATKP